MRYRPQKHFNSEGANTVLFEGGQIPFPFLWNQEACILFNYKKIA